MKKTAPRSKLQKASTLSASGICSYQCVDGEWQLVYDGSQPGYYCENSLGECNDEGDTIDVDAWPDGTEEEGGTEEGGTEEGGTEEGGTEEGGTEEGGTEEGGGAFAVIQATRSLPKNSALYRFVHSRKIIRRVRGAWAKGYYTPLEMTLKELAKFAPKVFEIVKVMSTNRAVESFQVIVPAQKLPRKKKGASTRTSKPVPKKANAKAAVKKAAVKKANPKTAAKKGSTRKKKR